MPKTVPNTWIAKVELERKMNNLFAIWMKICSFSILIEEQNVLSSFFIRNAKAVNIMVHFICNLISSFFAYRKKIFLSKEMQKFQLAANLQGYQYALPYSKPYSPVPLPDPYSIKVKKANTVMYLPLPKSLTSFMNDP
jgi:hypothetical protein